MTWKIIDETYLAYLRGYEQRVPLSDYGKDKYKPFFGELFRVGELSYVTQISHPQERHTKLKNNLDFYKIYDRRTTPNKLVGVVNLNYMFPIKTSLLKDLDYSNMDIHKVFSSQVDKTNYIALLKIEMAEINELGLDKKALRIYKLKQANPDDTISKRCLDFKHLETYALEYGRSAVTV